MATWKDYKAEVDRLLKEQEISEDIEICYVDTVGFPPSISLNDDGSLVIS